MGMDGRHAESVGEFVGDVVLWRRGDVSGCVVAGAVSAWVLLGSGGGYSLLSLASNVLLLLLSVLFLWAKAARLLNRPEPPIGEMRVPHEAVQQAAALVHSALDTALSAFRDIALGRDSLLFCRVFLCLWIISVLASLTDFPTFCYASTVGVLTIPALYQRYQECVDRYMRLAYMNLHMYEMVCERLSIKCFLSARSCLLDLLKDP